MRTLQGWLLPVFMLPMAVYAQEATVKEVHDAPAVRGSIIANMLQEHDNPFTLYPYDTNYLIYTQTSDQLYWPFTGEKQYQADDLKLKLTGKMTDYTLSMRTAVKGQEIPPATITLDAKGNEQQVNK